MITRFGIMWVEAGPLIMQYSFQCTNTYDTEAEALKDLEIHSEQSLKRLKIVRIFVPDGDN